MHMESVCGIWIWLYTSKLKIYTSKYINPRPVSLSLWGDGNSYHLSHNYKVRYYNIEEQSASLCVGNIAIVGLKVFDYEGRN